MKQKTHSVHVEDGDESPDLLRAYEALGRAMPVLPGHLVPTDGSHGKLVIKSLKYIMGSGWRLLTVSVFFSLSSLSLHFERANVLFEKILYEIPSFPFKVLSID